MFPVLLTDGADAGAGGGVTSSYIADICNNVADFMKALGSYIILIIGIALIIVSIIQVVKAFSERGQSNWGVIICCLLVGGLLTFGGWKIITNGSMWGGLGKNTVDKMMEGTTPTAIGDVPAAAGGTSAAEMSKKGIHIIASTFVVPFGKALAISIGVLMVILAVVQVAKFYFSKGRGQISWAKVAIFCVLGSALFTATPTDNDAGWTWIRDVLVGASKDGVTNIMDGNSNAQSDGFTPPAGFGNEAPGEGTDEGTDE